LLVSAMITNLCLLNLVIIENKSCWTFYNTSFNDIPFEDFAKPSNTTRNLEVFAPSKLHKNPAVGFFRSVSRIIFFLSFEFVGTASRYKIFLPDPLMPLLRCNGEILSSHLWVLTRLLAIQLSLERLIVKNYYSEITYRLCHFYWNTTCWFFLKFSNV
jgi:hypothetical protein